jgi:putative thioredoxin
MLGPILERLAQEPGSNFILAKLNVDHSPNVAGRYGVQGIPAVKGFRDGRVVAEFVGAQPEPRVRQFLKQVSPSEIDKLLSRAHNHLLADEWAAAVEGYRTVLALAPDHPTAQMGLVRALLFQGRGCEAETLLQENGQTLNVDQKEKLLPLAHFLCARPEPNGADLPPLEAQYIAAADQIDRGNLPAALNSLLDILRQDKHFKDGEAKAVMLALFELLGDRDPLTQQYRPQLAMVLF